MISFQLVGDGHALRRVVPSSSELVCCYVADASNLMERSTPQKWTRILSARMFLETGVDMPSRLSRSKQQHVLCMGMHGAWVLHGVARNLT